MKRIVLALVIATLGLARAAHADDAKILEIATLTPAGSVWMKAYEQWAKGLEQHSGGKLKVKLVPRVAGDDGDVVKQMKLAKLHGAALSGPGLGLIAGDLRVLELPMLFRDPQELDYVRTTLDGELRRKLEDKGYVLLAWSDLGPVYLFSNIAIKSTGDLRTTKPWVRVDDPILRMFFGRLGVVSHTLGVSDVFPSLQSSLIDACSGSPLMILTERWYTKVKFITQIQLNYAIGAMVISKKVYDGLGKDLQKVLMTDSRQLEARLLKEVRADEFLDTLKSAGLQVTDAPIVQHDFEEQAVQLRGKLEPAVYSHDFRIEVEKLLAAHRTKK